MRLHPATDCTFQVRGLSCFRNPGTGLLNGRRRFAPFGSGSQRVPSSSSSVIFQRKESPPSGRRLYGCRGEIKIVVFADSAVLTDHFFGIGDGIRISGSSAVEDRFKWKSPVVVRWAANVCLKPGRWSPRRAGGRIRAENERCCVLPYLPPKRRGRIYGRVLKRGGEPDNWPASPGCDGEF